MVEGLSALRVEVLAGREVAVFVDDVHEAGDPAHGLAGAAQSVVHRGVEVVRFVGGGGGVLEQLDVRSLALDLDVRPFEVALCAALSGHEAPGDEAEARERRHPVEQVVPRAQLRRHGVGDAEPQLLRTPESHRDRQHDAHPGPRPA